jgi:hypothetical protein
MLPPMGYGNLEVSAQAPVGRTRRWGGGHGTRGRCSTPRRRSLALSPVQAQHLGPFPQLVSVLSSSVDLILPPGRVHRSLRGYFQIYLFHRRYASGRPSPAYLQLQKAHRWGTPPDDFSLWLERTFGYSSHAIRPEDGKWRVKGGEKYDRRRRSRFLHLVLSNPRLVNPHSLTMRACAKVQVVLHRGILEAEVRRTERAPWVADRGAYLPETLGLLRDVERRYDEGTMPTVSVSPPSRLLSSSSLLLACVLHNILPLRCSLRPFCSSSSCFKTAPLLRTFLSSLLHSHHSHLLLYFDQSHQALVERS